MIENNYQLHNALNRAADKKQTESDRLAALREVNEYAEGKPRFIRDASHQEKSKILKAAIAVGDVEFLQRVILAGANIESKSDGDPVGFVAFRSGNVDVARALVDAGFSTSIGERSNVLLEAIESHNPEMIRYVFESFDGEKLIKAQTVAALSRAFLDVDASDLMSRSVDEHMRCIDVLTEFGVKPDAGWLVSVESMFGYVKHVTRYSFDGFTMDEWREKFREFADRSIDMLSGFIGDDQEIVSRIRGAGVLYACLASGMTRRAQWLVDNGMSKYDPMPTGDSWLDFALSCSTSTLHHEDADGKLSGEMLWETALKNGVALGIDVNRRSNSGETPLTKLISDLIAPKSHTYHRPNDLAAFFRTLPSYGFDFNAKSFDGRTMFMNAAMKPDEFLLKILAELGSDVGCKGVDGSTALHAYCIANAGIAARADTFNDLIIDMVTVHGVDPNGKNSIGMAPLHERLNLRDIRTLIKVGADVNMHCSNIGWTPLQYAARVVKMGISPRVETVTVLLDAGADVFLADSSGVSLADQARSGGLAVDVENTVMAEIAARTGELQDFAYSDGSRIIHQAARNAQHWALSRIKDIWGDVDVVNPDGLTALHLAVSLGHSATAGILLEMGADPNCVSPSGATALHMAVNKDFTTEPNLEMVKLLVANGADATLKYKGRTVASMRKDEQLTRILRSSAMGSSLESAFSGSDDFWPHAAPSKVDFGGSL